MRTPVLFGVALLGAALASGCTAPCRHFDFHQVSPGIYVGCRPRHPEDFAALRQAGIQTILSLETCSWHVEPERKQALRHQMNFWNVPILASPLGPTTHSVQQALLTLHDSSLRPIYIHCLYGRDRAAIVLALYHIYYEGLPPQEAWENLLRSGYNDGLGLWGFRHYFWHHTQVPDWAHPQTAEQEKGATPSPENVAPFPTQQPTSQPLSTKTAPLSLR